MSRNIIVAEAIAWVRNNIRELQANMWTDEEIMMYLNAGQQKMLSGAQFFHNMCVIMMQTGVQEYPLPDDVDRVTNVQTYVGVLYPLQPMNRNDVQFGSFVSSIPFYYYITTSSMILTPQVYDGSIYVQSLPPTQFRGGTMSIGVYPEPPADNTPLYVRYTSLGVKITNANQVIPLPEMFIDCLVAYATSQCLQKTAEIQESDRYISIFERGLIEFKQWQMYHGSSQQKPKMISDNRPSYFLRGANTVLVINSFPGM
ncbi:MAG: hypothetical protein QXL94_00875 [Candidatus Parvarchaeum sp.]